MTSMIATMPSTINSSSIEHRRNGSEAGPRGFTAVNIPSPPRSRESSAGSPGESPRHGTVNPGRNSNTSHPYMNNHDMAQRKRRRSASPTQDPLSPPRRYDYHPPRKVDAQQQQQHLADRALHVLDATNQHQAHSYYSTTPSGQERPSYGYDRAYSGMNGNHSPAPLPEDGRMSEAYSREPSEQHYASSANDGDQDKQDDGNERPSPIQTGQKRKRNFSNRTKTGCTTCRRRKKKCDEARPQCNNCVRGQFECGGYPTNATRPTSWVKQPPQKQPILLQSKENDEPGSYDGSETPISAHPSGTDSSHMRQHLARDGQDQPRPQHTSNPAALAESRPAYLSQPQHQTGWSQHQNHNHSPLSTYTADQLPPLADLARPEPHSTPQRQAYANTSQSEMSRPPPQSHAASLPPTTMAGPPQWQQQQQQPPPQPPPQPPQAAYQATPPQQQEYASRPPYPPRINTTQPQYGPESGKMQTANTATTASAAYSSYDSKPGSRVFLNEDVERSKMLRGAPYNYFDATLKGERQRCANALLRYNNACQLGSGISETETQAMLQKVFDPKLDTTFNSSAAPRVEGHLGPGVKIEPGFRCTYGYNIRIFDNVFIGESTRIDDSAKVDIGARTWIGANVTILTNDVAKDMVHRKGTDGQQCTARSVIIGAEVVIGTGAVILPGIKLGRGCTVEPFAHVRTDLADFSTQRVFCGPQVPLGVNY
ncbi:hypothetical protein LTR64_006306 [Lithohypha guttulata]|uniref:uncharacterized protein n=1 Tax=Lithohypha guttulata TaxID=1690604 RepID=UPI00315D278F